MTKFVRAINTFKNGLVSPRLRGSVVEPTDSSSAEILENFIIDRSGAAIKRPGLQLIEKIASTSNLDFHEITLMGTTYNFYFDPNANWNDVDGSYNSTYCKLIGATFAPKIKVFSKGSYDTTSLIADPMAMWNSGIANNVASDPISTGVSEYLATKVNIIRVEKVSDRTVVFTTDKFSFLLSLLDYAQGTDTVRQFYIYPYFVSVIALEKTLTKTFLLDDTKCPILPSNFPFNAINTETTLTITASVLTLGGATQIESDSTPGVVTTTDCKLAWGITVPKSITKLNGADLPLTGRFLSMPSTDTTKDVVFFLTTLLSTTSTTVTYRAIQVIGGVPTAASSAWKFSTWGDGNHPQAVGFCFGRLLYGNTTLSPTQWWASAIHPDNRQYFQGFMTTNLLQDASSDFSGMRYNGVAINTISTPTTRTSIADIYRFGFSDFTPNFGAINWITSRRRIHFGTDRGECQLTIGNGSYTSTSYEQNITGTDVSVLGVYTTGNRRIFYVSNPNDDLQLGLGGSDIRSISTEDKDYESIDTLNTVALQGILTNFIKIEWVESLNGILCLHLNPNTQKNELYFFSYHSDTQIKAFSKLLFTKDILGIAGSTVILKDSTTVYTTKLSLSEVLRPGFAKTCYGDVFAILISKTDIAAGAFAPYYGKTVQLYHLGNQYTFSVPSAVFSPTLLPFDPDTITSGDGGELYIFEDQYTAKLKTLPIHEGARFGSSVGDVQRVDRLTVLIDKSGPFKYGAEDSRMIDSEGVGSSDTKHVTIELPQSPDRECFVIIESSSPTPLNISGISLRGVSYSGE